MTIGYLLLTNIKNASKETLLKYFKRKAAKICKIKWGGIKSLIYVGAKYQEYFIRINDDYNTLVTKSVQVLDMVLNLHIF